MFARWGKVPLGSKAGTINSGEKKNGERNIRRAPGNAMGTTGSRTRKAACGKHV